MSNLTVLDIARLCNVSPGTIDRAINNRPGINPKTKQYILDTATKYGYIKNRHARSLSIGKSQLIGVVLFNLNNEFFAQLAGAIESTARKYNYTTLLTISETEENNERQCIDQLIGMNVDGMIICSVVKDYSYLNKIINSNIPIVSVGNRIFDKITHVGIDDFTAMYDSTKYVLSCGYKNIYYVSPILRKALIQNINAQHERYQGFLCAMNELAPYNNYTVIDDKQKYNDILPLIGHPHLKTAVICSSDSFTIDCLKLFFNTDIGIMGFDNPYLLRKLYPDLSTIRYPIEDIGKSAAEIIINPQKKSNTYIFPHILVPGNTIH